MGASAMWTSLDRWTCGSCSRTVVIDGSDDDTAAAITAVQWRHFRAHRDAAKVGNKMRSAERERRGAA